MNKNIFSKQIAAIFSFVLIAASQIFIAQAQTFTNGKTGRDFNTNSEIKQETEDFKSINGSVTAVQGNVTCKDLSPLYEEFKIDPPRSGTYSFAGNNSLAANLYGGEDGLTYVDYQSTAPFVAVIVKGGNRGSNIYSFDSPQSTASGLSTPNLQDISHLSFCYAPGQTVTAASASVSGRVINENGRGVARSMVTIRNLNTDESRTMTTNPFGYYQFGDLPVGNLYAVTITNKKAGLIRQTQSFVLNGDESDINFMVTSR